jgi:trigger factor
MNIIKEQNDNLSAQLKISIDELDYNDRVKKELNKLRGKAQMPGFRQGHVPFGMIQKMYGQAVLADEINKILQESVGKFLEDEKIDLLGAPFPAQDSPDIDFEKDKQFNFTLNIILTPEINPDFVKTLPAVYYKIKATDAVIDEETTALRQRFGTGELVQDSPIKDRDYLLCDYQSLENENIQSNTAFFVNKEEKPWSASFIGHKMNDTFEIDIDKAFEGDTEKASDVLKLEEEDRSQAKGVFKFTITEVNRKKEAELNEDFFKKAFPDKEIKTEKELRKAIAEAHSEACVETVEMWFFNANFDPLIEAANLHYDDEMLRQYMEHQKQVKHEEQEDTEENYTISDEEFEKIKRGTSWQLVQQKLMETYDIKVESDEIKRAVQAQVSHYFGVDPELADPQMKAYLDKVADGVMKDKKQIEEFYIRMLDKKITRVLIENMQITTKEITWDEFLKIIEAEKEKPAAAAPKKTKKTAVPKEETQPSSEEETQPSSEEEAKPKAKKPSTKKTKKENPDQQSLFE